MGARSNLNYAAYVSVTSIGIDGVESERHAGGRVGFFFPGPRLEVGASWQSFAGRPQERCRLHVARQPQALPLSMHSEFVRSNQEAGTDRRCVPAEPVHFWEKQCGV